MRYISALLLLLGFTFCHAENKVFYTDGPGDSKKVALTFDDGPGAATEKILAILEEKDVKATFFMLGCNAAEKPKLAKKVFEAGHEVQNHTYGHVNFYSYKGEDKNDKMEKELLKAQDAIEKAVGVKTYLVRFPYGYSRDDAKALAKKNKYKIINWTLGYDWDKKLTAEEMSEKYKASIKSGAVFLIHDLNNNERLLSFLPDFIDEIKEKGFEIVTVSELLQLTNNK